MKFKKGTAYLYRREGKIDKVIYLLTSKYYYVFKPAIEGTDVKMYYVSRYWFDKGEIDIKPV